MDYAITMQDGHGQMTFNPAGDIFNNIYLSLKIRRGAWFRNPEFGSRLHLLKKNTPRAEAMAEEYAKEALQWIIDTGKASKIDVYAQRDTLQDVSRLKLLVEATQADGTTVTFNDFVEVV